MGIDTWEWTEHLIGENGVLEIAVTDFQNTVLEYQKQLDRFRRLKDDKGASDCSFQLRAYRIHCSLCVIYKWQLQSMHQDRRLSLMEKCIQTAISVNCQSRPAGKMDFSASARIVNNLILQNSCPLLERSAFLAIHLSKNEIGTRPWSRGLALLQKVIQSLYQ